MQSLVRNGVRNGLFAVTRRLMCPNVDMGSIRVYSEEISVTRMRSEP
jgi:hypothetical protein